MKLQDQFTTIEQSKKLVELGINPDLAKFWHVEVPTTMDISFDEAVFIQERYIVAKTDYVFENSDHIAPAFSMAEVLKMLELNGVSTHTPLNTHKQADYLINRLDNRWIRIDVNEINKALQD